MWAWMVFLLPLLIFFLISVSIYVTGYIHAKSVSESLVPIKATITSVREQVCGGHARHVCYRIELSGTVDSITHKYRTYDVANGRFTNGGVQIILVTPHPRNDEISQMYLNKSDPVDEFKAKSIFLLLFIAFELGIGPISFWLGSRKKAVIAGSTY